MIKKYVVLIFVLLLVAALVGCHLDIKSDVDYPADLFKQTLKKIEALQRTSGPVSNLNMLVYAGDDRELISLSVPTATTKEALKWSSNWEGMGKGEEIEKYTNKIGGLKLEKLELLDRMGPGLVAEIEVDEQKDRVHVLIWLD